MPRILRCLIWIGGGGFLSLVIAWFVIDGWMMRRLEQARGAFGTRGYPTALAEILPQPVAKDENAAPLLEAAWREIAGAVAKPADKFAALMDTEDFIADPAEGIWRIQPARLADLRALAATPDVVAMCARLCDAATRPAFVPEIDFPVGPAVELPHVGRIRDVVRLLCACALIQVDKPATRDVAWRNIATAFTLTIWVGKGPGLIEGLTQIACTKICGGAFVGMVEAGGPPADLEGWRRRWNDLLAGQQDWLARACDGERLLLGEWLERNIIEQRGDWLGWFLSLAESPGDRKLPPKRGTAALSLLLRPYATRSLAQYYDRYLTLADLARNRGTDALRALREFGGRRRKEDCVFVQIFVPMLDRVAATDQVQRARALANVVLLDAFEHRQHTPSWSAAIENLRRDVAIPTDPCSGQPLVVTTVDDELLIYAFGFDGDDDGGRAVDPRELERDGDIVVRVRLSIAPN